MTVLKSSLLALIFTTAAIFVANADEMECILAKPSPSLNNGTFQLDEKGIATEHMQLNDKIELYIERGGCEYVSVTYKFIFKEPPAEDNVVGAEYRRAIELLTLAEGKPQLKVNFTAAKKTLQQYLDLVAIPKLQEELFTNSKAESIIAASEVISIDADLRNKPASVAVTISSGPY